MFLLLIRPISQFSRELWGVPWYHNVNFTFSIAFFKMQMADLNSEVFGVLYMHKLKF